MVVQITSESYLLLCSLVLLQGPVESRFGIRDPDVLEAGGEKIAVPLSAARIPSDSQKGMIGTLGIAKRGNSDPRGSKKVIIGTLGRNSKKGPIRTLVIPKR